MVRLPSDKGHEGCGINLGIPWPGVQSSIAGTGSVTRHSLCSSIPTIVTLRHTWTPHGLSRHVGGVGQQFAQAEQNLVTLGPQGGNHG